MVISNKIKRSPHGRFARLVLDSHRGVLFSGAVHKCTPHLARSTWAPRHCVLGLHALLTAFHFVSKVSFVPHPTSLSLSLVSLAFPQSLRRLAPGRRVRREPPISRSSHSKLDFGNMPKYAGALLLLAARARQATAFRRRPGFFRFR